MKLSFDDKESFTEAAGSLRFYNPPSDPNTTHQQVGTQERSEDIGSEYTSANEKNFRRNTSNSQDLGEE